jgi:hypothetical protein
VTGIALTGENEETYGVLNAGDTVTVTVTMDENTIVDTTGGTPRIALNIGGTMVYATYTGGSGSQELTFEYTLLAGQNDANGISIDADSIDANGGSLKDAAGNAADLDHEAVTDNAAYKVDTTAPIASISMGSAEPTANYLEKFEATGVTNLGDSGARVIALNPDGSSVIAFVGIIGGFDTSVFVQRLFPDGTKNGESVKLDAYPEALRGDTQASLFALGTTGKYAVVWQGTNASSVTGIFVQIFNNDGSKATASPVQVTASDNTLYGYTAPVVASVTADGNFVVTWMGTNVSGSNQAVSIYVQQLEVDGTLVGKTAKLDGLIAGDYVDQQQAVTAIGTQGKYVVAWAGLDSTTSSTDYNIYVQQFNADGTTSGSVVELEPTDRADGRHGSPKVIGFADGSFVVGWAGSSGTGGSVYIQRFGANGVAVGGIEKLDGFSGADYAEGQVTFAEVGAEGKYVLAWGGANNLAGSETSIYLQIFNADGSNYGSKIKLDGVTASDFYDQSPVITPAGSDGSFLVSWIGSNVSGFSAADTSVYVQKINADGTLNGSAIALDSPGVTPGFEAGPSVAITGPNEDILVAWNGQDTDSDTTVFAAKIVQPSGGGAQQGSSNEAGKLYLVAASATITSEADILALNDDLYNEQTNGGADVKTTLNTTGLANGDYKLYAVDLAGNLSAASADMLTVREVLVAVNPIIDTTLTQENYWRGSISGIELVSNTDGVIKLGGVAINTPAITGTVLLGGTDGVQTVAAQGVFTVTNGSAVGTDALGALYALGTDGDDTLVGQYVWGYGGYNTITGTDGGDWLIGGDEGNLFTGGKGSDIMYGGDGIDTFNISSANGDTGILPGGPLDTNASADSVVNFATGQDKLDLDVAGSVENFVSVQGAVAGVIQNDVDALKAAQDAITEGVEYVYIYNITFSGNSWLYHFFDGTPENYTIVELVGLNSVDQFAWSDIV